MNGYYNRPVTKPSWPDLMRSDNYNIYSYPTQEADTIKYQPGMVK